MSDYDCQAAMVILLACLSTGELALGDRCFCINKVFGKLVLQGGSTMWNVMNNPIMLALAKTLDAASLRQQVIAHNIANANTPGFKRSVVAFEQALQRALEGSGHGGSRRVAMDRVKEVQPQVVRDNTTSMRVDGNNVDMESEMAQLALNTLTYNTATQLLSSKFASARYVIHEGRK
ncbi:MAG: flagellar basal body rod protein FlgB [Bacillota bacterium]